MLMATKQDLAAKAYFSGDTLRITFTVNNDDGNAKDLTGATVTWALAKKQGSTPLVTKTATLVTPASGVCRVDIAPADTADINGSLYHELQVEDAAGDVSTVIYGQFVVEKDSITS